MKLTNQLVNREGRGPRPGRRRGPASDVSRDRLFAAAAQEFAAHGFAGASVDRIAAAARLNKAMIYYHFGSKAALYREILSDMFGAVGARVREVAAAPRPPGDKVREFVEVIASEAQARPHFPPIWFREVAEGGKHLDDATLGVMAGIVAPVLLFFATAGIRRRIARAGVKGVSKLDRDDVVAHVQRITLGVLEGRM